MKPNILQLFCKYQPAPSLNKAQPEFQEQQLQQKSNIRLKVFAKSDVNIVSVSGVLSNTPFLTHSSC